MGQTWISLIESAARFPLFFRAEEKLIDRPSRLDLRYEKMPGDKHRHSLQKKSDEDDGSGTLDRYRKRSFYWYRNVIRSNGDCLNQE